VKPKRSGHVDRDHAWFWSPRWRALEAKADVEFQKGRVSASESADSALRARMTKRPWRR